MVAKFTDNQASAAGALPAWNAGVGGVPCGFEQLTAGDLATAVFLAVPAGANLAEISIEAGAVRWRDDTVAPTSSIGMLFASTQPMPMMTYSAALNNIQFIAASGSPVINISYYR